MALTEAAQGEKRDFETPQYGMSAEELTLLSNEFLDSLDLSGMSPESTFACAEIEPGSKFGNLARDVESKVFVEEFGNTPDIMTREYGDYEDASRFWVVFDMTARQPIGALRAIEDNPKGFKTLNDIAQEQYLGLPADEVKTHYAMDPRKTWDVGTVAVLPEYRGLEHEFLPSLSLYRSLYVRALDLGIEHFISVIDKKARANLDLLGIPFEPILDSEDFSYLGSEHSWALHGHVNDFYEIVTAKQKQYEGAEGFKALIYKSMDSIAHGSRVDAIRVNQT